MSKVYAQTSDRIAVSKTARKIISEIDEKKCLGLESPFPRIKLFVFAMSLAMGAVKMPLKDDQMETGRDHLVRDESIDTQSKALIYACYITDKLASKSIDHISQKTEVYSHAQECANTGFYIISDYMKNHKPSELKWEMIKQMDEIYNATVKQFVDS